MGKIVLNIIEPGGPTPIDPAVPNTGLFTHGIGGPEATIITVSIVAIMAIVAAVLYYKKKHSKTDKATKLADTISALKAKKKLSIPLASLALVVSLGTLAALLVNAGKSNTSAVEGGLTVTTTGEEKTIEVGDEPVFAIAEVEATVAEATVAGYTLTAYTEDINLVSTTDSTNIIPMVAADEGELVALAENTYGLSLSEPEDKDSEVYTTLSTDQSTPTILKTIDDYSPTEANDTTTIYYGFYITPDVSKGTYEGSVINYEAEPNYITNLSFDGNGSDGGTAIEGMTLIAGDTITLPENTYTKEGYNFIGWNTAADGTGESYADEAEFTASTSETQDITLYAQWEKATVIGDLTYMQDFATLSDSDKASVLNSMVEGDGYQLKDNRDNKTYYISRLADGNIWMTQNLDLDLNSQTALTPANTNITANWTPANTTITFTGTTVDGWQNDNNVPYSADPGDIFYYSSGDTNNDTQYTSLEACQAEHSDCSAHNHAGNYYNWSAAVATNDTSSYTTQYDNMTTSICPAGWRLPKNANADSNIEGNEQITMINSYDDILGEYSPYGPPGGYYNYLEGGFNKIRTAPLWLARSGGVGYGSLYDTGSYGYYWSSTVYGSGNAYQLYFSSGDVGPAVNVSRSVGYSIRCVAE